MKKIKFLLLFICALISNVILSAPAPPPSGGGTGGPICWPPPCVPVDNGIIFLIVAGALFGAKKIYDLRKQTKSVS